MYNNNNIVLIYDKNLSVAEKLIIQPKLLCCEYFVKLKTQVFANQQIVKDPINKFADVTI